VTTFVAAATERPLVGTGEPVPASVVFAEGFLGIG
jgi:hypothetical protein